MCVRIEIIVVIAMAMMAAEADATCEIIENTAGHLTVVARPLKTKDLSGHKVTLLADESHRFVLLEREKERISVTEATPDCGEDQLMNHIQEVTTNTEGETVVTYRRGPRAKGKGGGKETHYFGKDFRWLRKTTEPLPDSEKTMGNANKVPWLNQDFLVKVLQGMADANKGAEVVSFKLLPPAPSGTHFMSQLFRVVVDYRVDKEDRTVSLIVKGSPPKGSGPGDNQREVRIYSEVFPEMFKLHAWRGVPRAFPSPLPSIIVMEDLKERGYTLYPRYQVLDFNHAKEFLINLSTFHALSVRLHHDSPELVESIGYNTGFAAEDHAASEKFWKNIFVKFVEYKECAEYAPQLRKTVDTFYSSVSEAFKPSTCLNVLTHNDIWLYNIMFRYDKSGEVVDSMMVDFETPRYCSFASDLTMFWWSSVSVETRKRQEELFEVYRLNLNKVLKELDCTERVSKTDFDSEMKKFAQYALRPVAIHLEMALKDKYRQQLPDVLKQIEEFGVFS